MDKGGLIMPDKDLLKLFKKSLKNKNTYIPNLLTASRLVGAFVIPTLFLTGNIPGAIIATAAFSATDFFDGLAARKLDGYSEFGRLLDPIVDKVFAAVPALAIVPSMPILALNVAMEAAIGLINAKSFSEQGNPQSSRLGKIKTWLICITIIVGFIGLAIPYLSNLVDIAIIITVLLQATTLIGYFIYWQQLKKSKDIKTDYIEFYKIIEPIIIEKEFQRRKEYPHHINESVYEHVIRVSYDCYKIGKRLGMDYKALTIAGLLHDFYEKPWQYSNEKKPFFQKHAFTHAKEAVVNSKKYFGTDIITPKVESIMITHMFPLNKKIPRNKEAWLLTLIDKADSIDFILHPVTLFKIFFHKKYQEEKENLEKQITHKTKSKKKKAKKSAK